MPGIENVAKVIQQELPDGQQQVRLSRRTRRAMERVVTKYKAKVEAEWEDDKRYFIENPSRNHRVRLAFSNEEKQLREMSGVHPITELPPQGKVLVLVKQLMPGVRMKKPAVILEGIEITDDEIILTSEEDAKELYETWRPGSQGFKPS